MKPVGPEPPAVYWRRRAVVALAVLLAVILIVVLWPSGGDPTPTAAEGDPAPAASASPSASEPEASPTASPTASPSSTQVSECSDSDLNIETKVDTADPKVGQPVSVSMTIANISEAPCTRDVGPVVNEFLITSGGYRVWSSDDCNPGGPSQVETIPPGQAFMVQAAWPAIVTSPGCPSPQQPAQAGSYDVAGANGSAIGTSASFTLSQ